MNKKTIYKAADRQGIKWFSEKPTFNSVSDTLTGKRINEPKNLQRFRVVKKFKVVVTGQLTGFYPKILCVGKV